MAAAKPAAESTSATPARRPRSTPRPRPAAVDTAEATAPVEVAAPTEVPAPVGLAVVDAEPVSDARDTAALLAAEEARSLAAVQEARSLAAVQEAAVQEAAVHEAAVHEAADGPTDVIVVTDLDDPHEAERPTRRLRHARRRRLRPPSASRRPALYLAAALVGALGFGAVSLGPAAQAHPAERPSHSMSVARQLGISSQSPEPVADVQATERLQRMAASRATREAEQAAAAQVQEEADRAAAEAAAEAARPKAVLPVDGARLTSGFGYRWGTLHAGIDLAAPIGTPEYAAADGVVLEAGPASGFGLAVYIQHENGDVTVYGHMNQILVEPGQVVRAGDTIALLGNRGQSTGPHLHFEVHVGGISGEKIDPIPWLRDRGITV